MSRSLPRFGIASGLFLFCLGCYMANGRTLPYSEGFDTIPIRLLPFSILQYRTITLEPFRQDFFREKHHEGFTLERHGKLISGYPIGAAFLALPIYVPYYAKLRLQHRASRADLFAKAELAEKGAAGAIAAISVVVFFLIVAPRLGDSRAAVAAMVFGLGTLLWATASQQLWQHGPGVLCLLAAILSLSRPRQNGSTRAFAGFWLGFAFAIRPQTAPFLMAGAAAEWLITEGQVLSKLRSLAAFSLGAFVPVAFTLAYNSYFFANPAGSYHGYESGFHLSSFMKGGPALILSPNRGLLFFTPIALIGLLGMGIALRHPRAHPTEAAFSIAAIVYFVLHSSFFTWAAGWTFGPRYLIETLPALALASTLAISRIPKARVAKIAVVLAIGWSVLVEWNGAFCYPSSNWNGRMGDNLEGHAWDFRHIELWEDFKTWKARRDATAPPSVPFHAVASESVSIATTTPTAIPAAHMAFTPTAGGRAFVAAVFDVTFKAGRPGIFVGKLWVNGIEQPNSAIFDSPLPHSRATISQVWTPALQKGKICELVLTGQVNLEGGSYLVSSTHTTLTVLILPKPR